MLSRRLVAIQSAFRAQAQTQPESQTRGDDGIREEDAVYYNDQDFARLVTRERLEQRLREAEATRLAREIRGTAPRRRRLGISVGLMLGRGRRAIRPRLEA